MKLSRLKKRLSQLNAKLRLFIKWKFSMSRKYSLICQILKLETRIQALEQCQTLIKSIITQSRIKSMQLSLSTLKKKLNQLNAKLRLFIKWKVSQSKKYLIICQILKLEAKIENLEQSQLPIKKESVSLKKDFNKKPNSKIFKAFLDRFENCTIMIPEFDEDDDNPSKLLIQHISGEISINNYQILPSNYYFQYWGKKKIPEVSSQLHGLYAAIGAILAKR